MGAPRHAPCFGRAAPWHAQCGVLGSWQRTLGMPPCACMRAACRPARHACARGAGQPDRRARSVQASLPGARATCSLSCPCARAQGPGSRQQARMWGWQRRGMPGASPMLGMPVGHAHDKPSMEVPRGLARPCQARRPSPRKPSMEVPRPWHDRRAHPRQAKHGASPGSRPCLACPSGMPTASQARRFPVALPMPWHVACGLDPLSPLPPKIGFIPSNGMNMPPFTPLDA